MKIHPKKEEAKQATHPKTVQVFSSKAESSPLAIPEAVKAPPLLEVPVFPASGYSEIELVDQVGFPFHILGSSKRLKVGSEGVENISLGHATVTIRVAGKPPVTIPLSRIAWIQE